MAIFNGEIYVTSFSTNSVQVFPVKGDASFPTRSIFGPSAQLSGPVGAFVF